MTHFYSPARSWRAPSIVMALLMMALTACNASSNASQNLAARDYHRLILSNAQIYTVNVDQPWAQAVVVEGDEIIFVGSTEAALEYENEQSYTLDLKGKMVLPGLHDTHLHPLEASSQRIKCVLEESENMDIWLQEVAYCHQYNSGSHWLLGWGHTLEGLLEAEQSPKALLDSIGPNRPIAIMEVTSHSVWVNSKALEVLGISSNSPDPIGGAFIKGEDGEPNGLLLDAAGDLVYEAAWPKSMASIENYYQSLLDGLSQVAANGITSIVDARVYWKRGHLEAWQMAQSSGELSARSVLSLWAYPNMNDQQQLTQLKQLYSNDPNSLLRLSQIKLYSDGVLHNTTAATLAPYLDYFPEVGATGLNYFSAERLTKYVQELGSVGFDMHIHTIGDRGVRESLNAIEAAQNQGARHRLTHVEMVNEKDMRRFAELGVIADFQLAGDFTKPEHAMDMAPLIGERAEHMLPVRDLYQAGALITLSSDWDVSALSPFVGMQNALTRGEQSLPDLDAVIRAYTINGAYSMRQEALTGSIEVGKKGDFAILDQNLFEVEKTRIAQTQVIMTILGGEIVYQRSL